MYICRKMCLNTSCLCHAYTLNFCVHSRSYLYINGDNKEYCIWAYNICTKTSSLILISDHVIWTSIGIIYSLWASRSTVPTLATLKQRGQKIFSRQHLNKGQQFDLDLWPCDLKIDRSHLLSWDTTVPVKFGNFQAKGPKYWADIA